jgi:hypothetical protein
LGLSIAVALWACSGGGISGTAFVAGPLAAFGSIFVNGIEFDTSTAVVTIEGDPGHGRRSASRDVRARARAGKREQRRG